jgi:uncharacterized membrane protein YphA (DoxX/SURF4 family)
VSLNNFLPNDIRTWVQEYPEKLGIIIIRTLIALMWFSQGFAKVIYRSDDMYLDHDEFLGQLNYMRVTHPNSFIMTILEDVLIPNVDVIVIIVIMTELFIAFSLGLGIFTRLGSLTGGLMAISLWIFTLGWDEWIWTYPLIFFPHVLLLLARSGREVGIDKMIAEKTNNQIINLLI